MSARIDFISPRIDFTSLSNEESRVSRSSIFCPDAIA